MFTIAKSVLHLVGADSHNGATFGYADGPADTTLRMDYERWKGMGAPKSVTVKIEPGDLLNG